MLSAFALLLIPTLPCLPASSPAPSPAVDCIECVCECCPHVTIEVCQGNNITIVRLTDNPPGPGWVGYDQSFLKTSSASTVHIGGADGCTFHPATTWGDVDECSDIHCVCDQP